MHLTGVAGSRCSGWGTGDEDEDAAPVPMDVDGAQQAAGMLCFVQEGPSVPCCSGQASLTLLHLSLGHFSAYPAKLMDD